AAERPTGTREHERIDLLSASTLEALVECGMLTVDWKHAARSAYPSGEGELARRDEALLVREREVDSPLERPQRGVDPGEANDRVQHHVGLRLFQQLGEVAAHLLQRRVDVVERRRAGCSRTELARGMRLDDLDRLAADRPGCTQEGDPSHGSQCRFGAVPTRSES